MDRKEEPSLIFPKHTQWSLLKYVHKDITLKSIYGNGGINYDTVRV